ncbi:hypothetical protein [Nitrobacter sp.]|uniref:hypothetical protein n=1 Tax=Nitrobacter sp. TaxID=29420 RepID=UPI0029CABA8C|nr:hypothetical protein [Nitrobacter sp.]
MLQRFRAKHVFGLDPGMETGSREGRASKTMNLEHDLEKRIPFFGKKDYAQTKG